VEIDPITGVFFVTERDYGRLAEGQTVDLATDAYPGETFDGRITRIAPVFKETTRQARVELTVANAEGRLKPGMFIRATVVLDRVADAVLVPEAALAKRNDKTGVFLLADDGRSVKWRPVTPGIREGDRVQILGDDLSGRVVTLGQQLVDDGSPVVLPADAKTARP
jgi:RND family efflux transporter MFP subunit